VSVNGWPRAEWTPDVVALADRVIASVLEGCGEGEDRIEDGMVTRIARRQCTDAERRRVTEKYLQVR
ncbi:MAG: hypothetical protein RJA36_2174, partial [Pseudomonadota bacterium]